jgi:hypothetical protein
MGIQVSLPAGGDPTLGFKYFVADNMALRGDLGLNITSVSGATQTFSLDAGLRYYLMKFDHFMPFVQPALYVTNSSPPASAPATMYLALQGGIGGEYFITDHFSFGAQTGVAFDIAFASSAPGAKTNVAFTTGTSAVFGQFLW